MEIDVDCAVCGATSMQNVIGSTNTLGGGPDLDLRPAEMERSTLWAQIQECPSCTYCAPDLAAAPATANHTLRSPRYVDVGLGASSNGLARRFTRASLVAEDADELAAAGWLALNAAWVCDDEGDESGAVMNRVRAAELLERAGIAGAPDRENAIEQSALRADIVRRAGRFREAAAIAEGALADADGIVASVLAFEVALARGGDDGAHRVEEALERFPPSDQEVAPLALGPRFERAVALALGVHRTQPRKGTRIPYVAHLLGVASLVLEDGGSEDEAIAALLHDAVEDGGGAPMLEQIRTTFGTEVADIVSGTSDTDEDPKPPWRERKERYIAHLRDAEPSVIRVSLADKLHNARAITRDLSTHGEELWRRFKPESDQLWYYRTLATVFRDISKSPMAAELEREVDEIERLAIVTALRRLMAYHDLEDYREKFVVIRADPARNYYVQFAADRGGLFCEAVHNMYLEDEDKLTSDQVGELLDLGWNPPDLADQNLYRTFQPDGDDDLRAIAVLSIRALREVYRVPHTTPLAVVTSWRDPDGS